MGAGGGDLGTEGESRGIADCLESFGSDQGRETGQARGCGRTDVHKFSGSNVH